MLTSVRPSTRLFHLALMVVALCAASFSVHANETGSPAFQAALKTVGDDPAAAYAKARGFTDPVERRVIQWAAIYTGNGAIDAQSIERFKADAPDFVSSSVFKTRLEQALVKANATGPGVITLLGGEMPNTRDGQLTLARAYLADGQSARAGRIISYIWTNDFLDAGYETKILSEFGALLTRTDHWHRAVHLLMHDRASGTERIMDKLSPAQQSLARARIAVARNTSNADALIDKVDPSLRDHSLFHFTRGQNARHKNNLKSAITFLAKAGPDAIDTAEFWYELRLISRRALAAGDAQTAYAAAAAYNDGPEGRVVDANFHAGWVALTYLNDAKTAIGHFKAMRALSTLPDTVTQSNYWLGRALKANGNSAEATEAFQKAAVYQTIYYGLLARAELGETGLSIRKLPDATGSETAFEARQLVKAVRLLEGNKRHDLGEPLARLLAQSLKEPGDLLLAARLAQDVNAHDAAISIADIAERRGVILDHFSFPRDGIPQNAPFAKIDKAAVYAVTRQESRFEIGAISRSGARGLMQLMPATAKEVARKTGVTYSSSKLITDAGYNIHLGSTYLASQLDRYDGSLVLAAAAYNAGAGNVNKWLKTFGDPRSGKIDPVVWIETIPFAETRKYTQRVMGNYMVYRARLGLPPQKITDTLRKIGG